MPPRIFIHPLRVRSRVLTTAVLVASLSGALGAHDFWIEPSTFSPAAGEPVRVHLRVGEHFSGEPVVRNPTTIEKFVVSGPSGEQAVPGRNGMDPAGLLKLDAPGLWFVGYRSRRSRVELDADAFEEYLREEGLERVIAERAARGEHRQRGRETFSRSVKALLRVGAPPGGGHDRRLGLTLELVPQADPVRAPGGRLPVRLVHDGAPLAEALVVGYRKNDKESPAEEAFRARTDADGLVTVPTAPGLWLLKAVHMQRAAAGSEADWDSVWTALTFAIPPAAP
jgi:uncharacterized GH25 family protein